MEYTEVHYFKCRYCSQTFPSRDKMNHHLEECRRDHDTHAYRLRYRVKMETIYFLSRMGSVDLGERKDDRRFIHESYSISELYMSRREFEEDLGVISITLNGTTIDIDTFLPDREENTLNQMMLMMKETARRVFSRIGDLIDDNVKDVTLFNE